MDADQNPQPVCAQEALKLLNCATETPYDPEKCVRLLESLRQCILNKVISIFLCVYGYAFVSIVIAYRGLYLCKS